MKPYRVGDRVMVRVLGTTRVATTAEIRRLARQPDGQSSAGYPFAGAGYPDGTQAALTRQPLAKLRP
jgi:hypothetical protein